MYCPNCGLEVNSKFCLECGTDLRNLDKKIELPVENIDYSKYLAYYPNKCEAIKQYRIDTKIGLSEAKKEIDMLFESYGEASHEVPSSRANLYKKGYTDYYEYIKYYPNKKRAIKEFMLDTNASKKDATAAVSEMFHRFENIGETVQPIHYTQKPRPVKTSIKKSAYVSSAYDEKPRKSKSGMTAGKAVGLAIGATAYVGLGVIFELAKGYTKRK